MSPLRDAVSLVNSPESDFPLSQNGPDRGAPELFGRNDEYTRIPHSNLIESILPLRHRHHAVDCHGARNAGPLHTLHLIRH